MKIFFALLIAISQIASFNWSECGHHIIAAMAFEQLEPSRQQELLQILAKHPRYAEDFKLPKSIKNQEQWLIGRAGYWPDVARGVGKEFNRPSWHYELGATNVIGNVPNVPDFPGPLPASATLKTQELHIAQAIDLCKQTLRDGADSDKALAICWLAHMVADAHQPCHAGSLYVEGVFPDGDRGANSIPTKQRKNMHALWDGLLGNGFDEKDVQRRMAEIKGLSLPPVAVADSKTWLEESRLAARKAVYTSEVMEPISVAMRSGSKELQPIDLPQEYLKSAGRLAQLRAWEASHRLADLLAQ